MAVVEDDLGAARDDIPQVILRFFRFLGGCRRFLCRKVLERFDGNIVWLARKVVLVHQTIVLREAEKQGSVRGAVWCEIKS